MRTTSRSPDSTARTTPAGERAVSSSNSPPFSSRARASRMSAWSSAARTRNGRGEGRTPPMLLRLDPPVAQLDHATAEGGVLLRVGDLDDGGAFGIETCAQLHHLP